MLARRDQQPRHAAQSVNLPGEAPPDGARQIRMSCRGPATERVSLFPAWPLPVAFGYSPVWPVASWARTCDRLAVRGDSVVAVTLIPGAPVVMVTQVDSMIYECLQSHQHRDPSRQHVHDVTFRDALIAQTHIGAAPAIG